MYPAGLHREPYKFAGYPIETLEKCPILFKAKEGENFNHRNT